ncbi:MAG TPA: HD domain-containing phosphohydrolase, partial [Polyangiaceae bacterium]|nr:HD domain-containing phosphohydrolase [Polyangiaceae bacterium]
MKQARVLCVDDEPKVLEGIGRLLHRKCTLSTAGGGEEALGLLAGQEPFDVIVSDMRMPGMNGATLLAECRRRAPDTVRMLLTGQSDLESAISAVNDGHVFRFLTKPCPPPIFLGALTEAVEHHRLITSERVLLEQTLVGSVRALTEVLALVHPEAFGSTARQHERARLVAAHLQIPNAWQVEVASMLSQVGYVVLPNELLAKVRAGTDLDATERGMLSRVPLVVERVLSLIPRLEAVQEVLKYQDAPFLGGTEQEAGKGSIPIGSRILRALADLGIEETRSPNIGVALAVLHARRGKYDPRVLDAIAALCAPQAAQTREVTLRDIEVGMALASDVTTIAGMLLVSRGHPVTAQLIERLRNFDLKVGV